MAYLVTMRLLSNSGIRLIIDGVAVVLGQAYQLARARLAGLGSPVLDRLLQRDHLNTEVELYRRELAIYRAQREAAKPHKRPTYGPEQRWAILQLMKLRGWNIPETAERFVLHPNTIGSWPKEVESGAAGRLLGDVTWNRIDDGVRWVVHELRRLFPEPEFGRRTIANHLIRAGVRISPRTVQRVLREEQPDRKPRKPRLAMKEADGGEPHGLLLPFEPNRVWHLDLTSLRVLWYRYSIAGLLGGATRKLLAIKVYRGVATSGEMIELVRDTAEEFGRADFLITDRGCQFRKVFRQAAKAMGMRPVRGPVRKPCFNGKIERFFRTLRVWMRVVLWPLGVNAMQARLDDFRRWYNRHRPHQALRGLTPDEAWDGEALPEPLTFRSMDKGSPVIMVERKPCRGDPRLPSVRIRLAA